MRTRRSPRNQDILFRALFQPASVPVPPVVQTRCFDCESYPPRGRSWGHCALHGKTVLGLGEHQCFRARRRYNAD